MFVGDFVGSQWGWRVGAECGWRICWGGGVVVSLEAPTRQTESREGGRVYSRCQGCVGRVPSVTPRHLFQFVTRSVNVAMPKIEGVVVGTKLCHYNVIGASDWRYYEKEEDM